MMMMMILVLRLYVTSQGAFRRAPDLPASNAGGQPFHLATPLWAEKIGPRFTSIVIAPSTLCRADNEALRAMGKMPISPSPPPTLGEL